MDPTGSTPTTCRSARHHYLALSMNPPSYYSTSPLLSSPFLTLALNPASSSRMRKRKETWERGYPPLSFSYYSLLPLFIPSPSFSLPLFHSSFPPPSPPLFSSPLSLPLSSSQSPPSLPLPSLISSLTTHLHIRHDFLELATNAGNSPPSSCPNHHHVQLPPTLVNDFLCCTIVVC